MTVRINLGLQGGGAHGAFTWGVLDALLEDGRLEFDGVSGSSAGAMNAVVLAHGWLDGGADGARAALRAFWTGLAGTMPIDVARHDAAGRVHLVPALKLWMMLARHVAPVQLDPFDLNPLRELLARQVDFERLRRHSRMQLYIAATNAGTGALRLFRNAELDADALLASSCLPTVFRAPRIDGETWWDGGYSANPAVFPLLHPARSRDTLLVLLSPLRFEPPQPVDTAKGIQDRIAEIAFTAAFRREMQALARERREGRRRWWSPLQRATPAQRARFHLIEAQPAISHFAGETRLAVNLQFFETLHALGRSAAQAWLAKDFEALGRRDSVDLQTKFDT